MSTDITVRREAMPALPSSDEIDRLARIAGVIAGSGMFKDAGSANQAGTKMLVGASLGLSPVQAMTALHVFDGKIELSANLQASMVREHPDYDYRVDRMDDEGCTLTFLRTDNGTELGVSSFTKADAVKAGLWEKKGKGGGPGVWQQYPRNMCFARAMSNGVAWYCPDVTLGIRVYAPGEVSDDNPATLGEPPASISVETYDGQAVEIPNAAVEPESEPAPPVQITDEDGDRLNDRMSALGLRAKQVKELLAAAGVDNAAAIPAVSLKAFVKQLTPDQAGALDRRIADLEHAAEQEAKAA